MRRRVPRLHPAWQQALAAEHQAVFGYGLLGPHLESADTARAVAASDAHETIRNHTETAMAAAGLTPTAPRADYPALYPVPDAAAARRLAVRLEDNCAAGWRALFAAASAASGHPAGTLRAEAQRQLTAAAVRATQWRAVVDPHRATTPFPGL